MLYNADKHDTRSPYKGAPVDDPLWETQVALERAMTREGADIVRGRVDKARGRNEMSDLRPMRGLIAEWLPKLAAGMDDWLKAAERSRGVKPVAAAYFYGRGQYTKGYRGRVNLTSASLLALQTLLDGFASETIGVTGLACEIGRRCEHEAQVDLWEREHSGLFYGVQSYLDRTGATPRHREKVNIHKFNELLADGKFDFEWQRWDAYTHTHVGIALLSNIMRLTGWFDVVPDPTHIYKRGSVKAPKKVIVPKDGIKEWLFDQLDREEALSPLYQPMVVRPRRWDGTRQGAYWTPYVRPPRLIRFKVSQVDQREAAADEYERLDMPNVYDAVHYLQEVPWRVNMRVLSVMRKLQGTPLGKLALPSSEASEPPPKPKGMPHQEQFTKTTRTPAGEVVSKLDRAAYKAAREAYSKKHPKAYKEWVRAAFALKRKDLKHLMVWRAWSRTFKIATMYEGFIRFYFPHMLDFRCRMYPIPLGLHPQGHDTARGLLEFAEGRPVTERSARWLAINLATQFGVDKVSFEERIAWVEQRNDLWRRIAEDPTANHEWITEADQKKQWQALAAVFDWVGYLNIGPGYVSHAPVSVDGTCNGIQHLSAMTRDVVAGAYVNLTPNIEPQDIYQFVADKLQSDVERIEAAGGLAGEMASYWLDTCARKFRRDLTKRQVMVLPYGGTRESFFEYTREWLDKNHPENLEAEDAAELAAWLKRWLKDQSAETQKRIRKSIKDGESPKRVASRCRRNARIKFLATRMWDIVGESVSGGVGVMGWLQRCAKHATPNNQPIYWKTPCGFVVRHFYGKQVCKEIVTALNGERVKLRLNVSTKDLDIKSQLQGIAPNFVHSLDASALVTTLLKARDAGIASMTSIHDAYGTHAADMDVLFGLIREAFVETHQTDMLAEFRNACVSVKAGVIADSKGIPMEEAWQIADEEIEPVPAKGDLELRDVLRSDYFFA